jgi:hypothetical protein
VRPPWLRSFANTVIALSAADALFSLFEETLRALTGATALAAPRSALAQVALLALAATVPGMLVTPRLPVHVFLPLVLATFWLTLGAAPLGLWVTSAPVLAAVLCLLQLAAVALAFATVRAHNGGRSVWFDAASPERPAFAWHHSLAVGAALLTLGPALAIGYGAVAVATWVSGVTHGFVHFGLEGVSLAERRYQREGREIRLVGMMHIGDPAAYRALTRTFARESTVVLAEGVSDRGERLSGSLHYGRAAQALGLAPQQDLDSYLSEGEGAQTTTPEWPVVRHADVDTSVFSPATISCIQWASEVWDADDLASALQMILAGARERGPELEAFQSEVLGLRNEHLVAEIERALPEFEHVVVPWGALHLPAIERAVLDWGFAETSRDLHPLFAWNTVVAALW